MRIGKNPEKEKSNLEIDSYHRIIIPVYVPDLEQEYFKDGLKILELCLKSLLATVHPATKVSLIDNGCCREVRSYLAAMHDQHNCIDQLYTSDTNLGKVNAIYAIAKSNLEPLMTIADADVMFLPGWQKETEQVFEVFPSAGMVSPVPSSRAWASPFASTTLFYGTLRGIIRPRQVQDPEGMLKFQESIGREMYEPIHLQKYLVLSTNKGEAVIGCGHFVATMRKEVFEHGPRSVCQHKIVGGSENNYLDVPNNNGGFLRLSTLGNYAYHLGNVYENWMRQSLDKIIERDFIKESTNALPEARPLGASMVKMGKPLHKIISGSGRSVFLKSIGLPRNY